MANIIAGLGAQLGLDTTEFRKGIGEAKSSLKELKEYLPEALSAAAVYELIHASMELSNQIVETAKANEIATASVLELSKALEENGGNAEQTGRIFSGFSQKLEMAVQGNATAQHSFERLGISLNDLAHLSTQDLFEKTVTSLSKVTDAAERNGLAMQVLGKAIRGVDIKGLAVTMEETKGTMDKYAAAVEKAHELSLQLEAAHKKLVLEFTTAVIPSLAVVYESFTKTGGAMEKVASVVKYISMTLAVTFKEIVTGATQVYDVLKALVKWAWDFTHLDFKKAGKDLIEGWDEVKKDGQDYIDFIKKIVEANKEAAKPVKTPDHVNRVVQDADKKAVGQAEAIQRQYENQLNLMLQQIGAKNQLLLKTKNEEEQEKAVNAIFDAQLKALDNIDKALANLDKNNPAYARLKKGFEEAKASIDAITFNTIPKIQEAVKKNQEYQTSFSYGWNHAFDQYKENAMNAAEVGKQSFESVVSNMSNALANFAKTGKLDFKSLTQSIIADLIRIQVQYQSMQLFKSVWGAISLFGGAGGSTGTDYSLTSGQSIGGLGLKASAAGGPLGSGEMSVVGENGPELFIPKSAGTVIPNSGDLSGANLGSTTINNYNISAIDTKSFEERIYGSSRAIWAANQYATKNIATNRSRT